MIRQNYNRISFRLHTGHKIDELQFAYIWDSILNTLKI